MASLPILAVLEHSQVSPPPATVGDRSLPLSCVDIKWLLQPPVHHLFFYELPLTKTQFIETIVPNLKQSLSFTLKYFFPYAGNLIVFPSRSKKPEIRYVEGDSVKVTIAECDLDFNDLTGNHPRNCDKFYPLVPPLGECATISDYIKMPVFSVQLTCFPNHGFSIAMTTDHCVADASAQFGFLKAWTSISRHGTDEPFLAEGALPIYERMLNYPELEDIFLKRIKVELFNQEYRPPSLSGPTDKVRATFILTRTITNRLKRWVSTQLPTLAHVSSFTVASSYIWSCIAKARSDEQYLFVIFVDARARMCPPIPAAYFGNCLGDSCTVVKTSLLTGNDGFKTLVKLIGENLQKALTDKDGLVKDSGPLEDMFSGIPTPVLVVAGSPKLKFYDMDFGWGKPKKQEIISLDYSGSISMNACKESIEDMEIGVCLSAAEMETFVRVFNDGLEAYI